MPTIADRLRRLLPSGMTGLAATACAACCVLPPLLAAGLGGAGWAAANRFMPGVAIALAVLAGLSWWWAGRRTRTAGCSGGNCSCDQPDQHGRRVVQLPSDA
ncbi:hypothetical protein [Micromonospora sp. 4G55]|uniref:hypothetical protein n=1 Tax=Micromonospora sp. 4G55 TaxID=2806102 RepID=UPI001A63B406|nr:hypothetical protein [Micromonospora sp. 4G55]MBM0256105.1 hypothetical protein [Micromonospora sp. 4G55]MBM0256296.1 hypothetical protein [Micromonospora sp. 4G55]